MYETSILYSVLFQILYQQQWKNKMTCFVKYIKPSAEFLNLTRNGDYFIIKNIFVGHTAKAKKIRLFKSLFMMTKPCQSSDQIDDLFLTIQQIIHANKLQHASPNSLIWKLLPKLQLLLDVEFVIIKNNQVMPKESTSSSRS